MQESDFTVQATQISQQGNNRTYQPISEYPTAFSTGYVRYENMPKNLIPSYSYAKYTQVKVDTVVTYDEMKNTQNNVYDVFYFGMNSSGSYTLNGDSITVTSSIANINNSIAKIGSWNQLYGEFKPRNVVRPAIIEISVRFCGYVQDVYQNTYGRIYFQQFSLKNFILFKNDDLTFTFTHADRIFNLKEFKDGVLWRSDETAIGFYFISYDFAGWGRNTGDSGYSYLFPTIGAKLTDSIQEVGRVSTNPSWLLNGSYGNAPYGTNRRTSWGVGLRTRLYIYNSNVLTPLIEAGEGTQYLYDKGLNAGTLSYCSFGFSTNLCGYGGCIFATTETSLIVNWTKEKLIEYHDLWTDNQRQLFIPEGRSDFGVTVPICTFDDIWKHICLFPVWSDEYEYAYQQAELNEHFWYAEIIDNEYTGNLVRGDDPDIYKKVPAWILNNNSVLNDYLPDEDRPNPEEDPDYDEQVKPPLIEGDTVQIQRGRTISVFSDFMTLYNLTATQLSNFGSFLWSSFNDIENNQNFLKNIYAFSNTVTGTLDISQILNFITSLRIYPFDARLISGLVTYNANKLFIGTGKVGINLGNQAVGVLNSSIGVLDCGEIFVKPETPYNDFRDYYNTTITCFLPYCGTIELNPIEVINNTLHCYYVIDFYTGECCAMLELSDGYHNYLCANANGLIGVPIPISATNSAQLASRNLYDNAIATKLIGSAISTAMNAIDTVSNFVDDNASLSELGQSINSGFNLAANVIETRANKIGRSAVLAPSLAGGSGGSSFCLPPCPYIQIRRGTYAKPSNYAKTVGYPLTKSGVLSSFKGLTICKNVDVSGLTCTQDEQTKIKMYLETGVYV